MNSRFILTKLLIISLVILMNIRSNAQNDAPEPPAALTIPEKLEIHGHTRIDNYFWMNKRDDEKVLQYLAAENEYFDKMMKHTEELQETIYNEIIGRIKQDDSSVPYLLRGFYYYVRYEEGKDYPIFCRKKGSLDADEEIMLNVNILAEGFSYYQVTGVNVSPDNNMIIFGVDTLSRRKYDLFVKDLRTGKIYDQKVGNTTGSSVWANDNKTFYYTIKDHTLRSYKIFSHSLGEPVETDKEVYHEADETFSTFIFKTKSEKHLIIGSRSTVSSEFRYLEADKPEGEFKIIQPRIRDLEYSVDHMGDKFFIVTNYKAENFRLMTASMDDPSLENWTELIPHRKEVLLSGIELFNDFLVLQEREKGLTQIRIIEHSTGNEHLLDFGEPAYTAYVSVNRDFNTDLLRYNYTSLTTPNSTIDYNMNTREKTILKVEEVLGGFDRTQYVSERLYAPADDGTLVPVSLVYKKGLSIDGKNPLLLYGYGSYGISMDPSFSSARLSLIDRGFIYAIAHIRGGQELGRSWYEDGKMLKKKNTFTDFIACAQHLIGKNYTNPENLFAMGGSAGGLLMGAVVNMNPELFKGIIASVPFVDVVTTMLDESIPLTTSEYDEWGNPNEKEYYDYILSYSPYDNVEAKEYPAMLVITGYHDSQVQYWEPAKWVAKLRELKTDNNLLLFKTDMDAGHSGASGRYKRFRETALQYAFLIDQAGIK